MSLAGAKCKVCIGCGRCSKSNQGIQVVSESYLFPNMEESFSEGEAMAVDIGTTTIAIVCLDARGNVTDTFTQVNPQRSFGADVLSRIEKAENSMLRLQMASLVKKVISDAVCQFHEKGYRPQKGVIAGNTTMMYLLLQHDPEELGKAPFSATYLQSEEIVIEGVPFQTVPGFSAFVGGDLMAGVAATNLQKHKGISLLVDLGTNGEIVLAKDGKIWGTATAAGPAFEGGTEWETGDFACDRIRRVEALWEKEYLDGNGNPAMDWPREGITVGDYSVSIEMVQAILVAKAAVRAGMEILLQEAGVLPKEVERVYLAGGFGYFLDVDSALSIGLFPKEFAGKIQAVGNSALAGARNMAMMNRQEACVIFEKIAEEATIVNLAQVPSFSEIFMRHMGFET